MHIFIVLSIKFQLVLTIYHFIPIESTTFRFIAYYTSTIICTSWSLHITLVSRWSKIRLRYGLRLYLSCIHKGKAVKQGRERDSFTCSDSLFLFPFHIFHLPTRPYYDKSVLPLAFLVWYLSLKTTISSFTIFEYHVSVWCNSLAKFQSILPSQAKYNLSITSTQPWIPNG